MRLESRERGFGLVAAMFLIIVVAAVIATMARLAVTQNATTSLAIQQARAYQAARAGLEYGIARVLDAPTNCVDIDEENFSLDGFDLLMKCTSSSTPVVEEEGNSTLTFYTIEAEVTFAAPASPDYAYRKLTAVVEKP